MWVLTDVREICTIFGSFFSPHPNCVLRAQKKSDGVFFFFFFKMWLFRHLAPRCHFNGFELFASETSVVWCRNGKLNAGCLL